MCVKSYLDSKDKKWDLIQEDFKIDENNNFTHATWQGVFCQGGNTIVATIEIINRFINECNKPEENRDFSFLNII